MSLTSRIQDQKDHITQAKKDLCSKVGISQKLTKRVVLLIISNLLKGHG